MGGKEKEEEREDWVLCFVCTGMLMFTMTAMILRPLPPPRTIKQARELDQPHNNQPELL
jgi:hypothetical protein